jgi:mono/diheme cytochrome c family protein
MSMFPKEMPRWIWPTITIMALLSFVPLVTIAVNRSTPQQNTRISIIPDMDKQQKFLPQSRNNLFRDGRGMRPVLTGTVPYQSAHLNDHLYKGIIDGEWATTFPVKPDQAMMERGEARYNIYCTPCHGVSGFGNGMVHLRAVELEEGTWVQPKSLHDPLVRERPVGHLYNSIANGIRTMPPYGPQIHVEDRWAIVLYVRALQRSQYAKLDDVQSADDREQLEMQRSKVPTPEVTPGSADPAGEASIPVEGTSAAPIEGGSSPPPADSPAPDATGDAAATPPTETPAPPQDGMEGQS